ncbi:hypothetical protein OG400_13445 [Micromonospora ureilytica]|uniref:hypothetical protein n=1 Tax=Micromonospora ureilytica TaxID=709868 RepID=UPI002E163171|nr:hypothetical protein OG400_13445 [Micromonospora ureilytica]
MEDRARSWWGLRRAYGALFAEVDAGGFGPAPEGQLSAEQIVAHLVANDELMIQATEALLHGTSDRLCGLVDQLGLAAETPVATHLREGFDLIVDEPLPWSRTLDLHMRVHLPKHQSQLHVLRS